MLHRSIPYGLVLGLGTIALAVLLATAGSDTNDDAETTPGLGLAPSYAVLGDETTPNTGPTTIDENLPAICPNTEFLAQAGASNTALTLVEPTPNASERSLPTPCIHGVAWLASPVP
jgi:hypothetical protein